MHMELGPRIILRFSNGVYITETVFWAAIVAAAMIIFALISTRNLQKYPKGLQAGLEIVVEYVYKFVTNTMGKRNIGFAPYIGTLFFFLLFCNALGLIGQRAPSADMNFTFAMGILVFFLIQINGIRAKGIKGYFAHYAKPFPPMIPLNIIEEIVFPVSLSFRIFGNILAGFIVVELWMHMMASFSASLHLPIPALQAVTSLIPQAFFDIFEPILQAFVFSMLTMSFISKANVFEHKEEQVNE